MSTHAEPQVETCLPTAATRLFCNRTLNLRSIQAVGFDMDYTLVHYHTEAWERRCYEHVQERLLADLGWPVGHLRFDQDLVALGLIMDLECGNIVKANRFGFVRRASHGTRMLSFEEQKELYAQTTVDLAEPRWVFMNTLFALSEACLYAQAVDLLDRGEIEGTLGYRDLYDVIRNHIDQTHMEGQLKAEIVANPERFVSLDEDLPLVLRDLKASGKRVILITNSGWNYTQAMMRYVIDPFLPGGQRWRDLFDLVVVAARKPSFFAGNAPFYEVVEEERGLLKPVVGPLVTGGAYVGGHARAIEAHFDLAAEQILYVGDHIFADVKTSK
ncbi:MAG: HAD-IG family 5'-nucleotidase, partial [Myxococcota bacterium]